MTSGQCNWRFYHRINSNSPNPYIRTHEKELKGVDLYERIQCLMERPISPNNEPRTERKGKINFLRFRIMLWCDDGKRHLVNMYFDRAGVDKHLLPNHRANAMIDAGRYTTKEFNEIDKMSFNPNQCMKDVITGPNYVYGDAVCVVPAGAPGLDHSIYGNNPISFMLGETRFGCDEGDFCMSPRWKMKNSVSEKKLFDRESWEYVDYLVCPRGCEDEQFRVLLRSWGKGRIWR